MAIDLLPNHSFGPVPLWASGRFSLRVDGPARGTIDIRSPYALIGREPGCDLVLDDSNVAPRHVYLHLDSRGLFGVDLASGLPSQIGPDQSLASWLVPGDTLQIGNWTIQLTNLELQGTRPRDHEGANPLTDHARGTTSEVVLYPESGPPLVLNSELVFMGSSRACGIWLDDPAIEAVHGVMVRSRQAVYILDLAGRCVAINGRRLHAPAVLRDGDHLFFGQTRLECRIASASRPGAVARQSAIAPIRENRNGQFPSPAAENQIPLPPSHLLAAGAQHEFMAWLLGMLQASQSEMLRRQSDFQHEVRQTLHNLQSEQTSALVRQLEKMENVQREVSGLREEIRRRYAAADPGRLDPPRPVPPRSTSQPLPPDDGATAAWLMHRIQKINQESRTALKNRRHGK